TTRRALIKLSKCPTRNTNYDWVKTTYSTTRHALIKMSGCPTHNTNYDWVETTYDTATNEKPAAYSLSPRYTLAFDN
ncbi:19531_t:CDS:2, partial [Racocetra fulgida]